MFSWLVGMFSSASGRPWANTPVLDSPALSSALAMVQRSHSDFIGMKLSHALGGRPGGASVFACAYEVLDKER
ncbi:hypothetical protein D9M71_194570 [compost metagenome]